MTAVSRVAIVGSGVAGTAAAILLAEGGVHVDVFEQKPDLSTLGSGITLQGNALRVFDRLGVWERVKEAGYTFDVLGLRAPGPDAQVIAQIPDAPTGGPEYPATLGMYRPDLARILADRATELGARIHYGTTVTSFTQDPDGVDVTLSDGSTGRYDVLIGADGLHSSIRKQLGIETEPQRTGMGIWRAFVPRPAEVTHTDLYYGGGVYIAGYCPTSDDMMYAYLVEPAQDRHLLSPEEGVEVMKELSRSYGGPWNEIRESLGEASRVNYTWFTKHVVPDAWNRGRVVIIGDAAHSCPPTIAQGAAQAAEDALVLSELLLSRDAIDQSLWDAFHARRLPRATQVVEASVQLGQWQIDHEQDADVPGLVRRIAMLVSEPA
ncbi:FAD-dependent oxidoreductase [Agromyces albus]|uniref:FAD-dependent oxidoreductase n=1 Tax=Agromyces albus TaxID=205332 RepID=UPI002789222F|nr:FAD-dependent oxidoreductase [Agromyces albus]MDQ0573909.1 2-polyprenyl-6-methoxyphenol hydroxylase-like FAD-dependent oxidoreductase [Agromyces albus]